MRIHMRAQEFAHTLHSTYLEAFNLFFHGLFLSLLLAPFFQPLQPQQIHLCYCLRTCKFTLC